MIRRINGTVIEVHPTRVVVDVHGIGYEVHTTAKASHSLGEQAELYTHLAVRENSQDLYGFASSEELSFFELLLSLPKIGPKSALQILSQADTTLLQSAIISQDATHLSKMSGISKKTAEKIVLGLKDSFDQTLYSLKGVQKLGTASQPSFTADAIDALITLGYSQNDAREAIQQLVKGHPEIKSVHEAVKEALRIIG